MHSGTSQTSFLVSSPNHELIAAKSFQCRLPGDKNMRVYRSTAFSSLEGVEQPDLVVFGVKSYALDEVVEKVIAAFGTDIPVMSVLNGVRHVEYLSKKFPNAIFCTIAFNAYRTTPYAAEAVGGTVALSATDPSNPMMETIHQILKRKISVQLVKNPLDAAHCKLIINLGNALLTMVAFHENRRRQLDVLQKLTAEILNEGVNVMKKAGVKEVSISGMPNWFLIRISKMLPQRLVLPIFEEKMKANTVNSMAQDLQAGSSQTELEDINGYFLQLAEKVNAEVPYNRALYHLFKEWQKNGAQPMRPSELLEAINSFSKR